MADYNSSYTGAQIDEGIAAARAARTANGLLISDGSGNVSAAVPGTDYQAPQELSILFVGNSLTQDAIAYLPYLLRTYSPDVAFRFYMLYNPGFTLAQQYEQFVAGANCKIFSVAENTASWINYSQSKTMSQILSEYRFDVVCMQEYFNYADAYTSTQDWDNCQQYIQSHYAGTNGLEFVSLFHAPLRSEAGKVYNMTKYGNGQILSTTIAQDMIPAGIAVYRALSTSLDSLGDQGHLSPDGKHTQEGLPCLLQAYVAYLWVLSRLSINRSIYGLPMRMTTEIYNAINVPGPNLGTGVITGTDAQNLLAQKIAIQAYKEGKVFVSGSLYSEVSVTAAFAQGGATIYTSDPLDDLRQYLTVTVTHEDGTSEIVTDYALSGELVDGESTIIATYDGATAAFVVTATDADPVISTTFVSELVWSRLNSGTYSQYMFINPTSASGVAGSASPIRNNSYTFAVTDTAKYQVAVYGITSLQTVSTEDYSGNPVRAYPGVDNGVVWASSAQRTTPYVAVRIKKLDGTNFTAAELADGAAQVITHVAGNGG